MRRATVMMRRKIMEWITVRLINSIVLLFLLSSCLASEDVESQRRIVPVKIEIREGEEMLIRLTKTLEDEMSCYVKTPARKNCNLKVQEESSCDERIVYRSSSGECGALIKNVQKQDAGWWRLTSKNDSERIVDAAMVRVLDKYRPDESDISIIAGWGYKLEFQDVHRYCMIKDPHNEDKVTVTGECSVELRSTMADNGTWNAVVGVAGQINEVFKTKTVSVHKEQLYSGYNVSLKPSTIVLFCNLKIQKPLSVCRFSKSGVNEVGLRLSDGLHKGRYGYYGSGLSAGECGLRIQAPEKNDLGQWFCVVGVEGAAPLGTSIHVVNGSTKPAEKFAEYAARAWSTTPVITTFMQELSLECFASVPLRYCWFSLPNGELLTSQKPEDNSSYSYSIVQEELSMGKCSIKIDSAESEHNGTWSCHMGPMLPGLELIQSITVRVAGTVLAAVQKYVTVEEGGNVEIRLICKTVPRAMALEYCRFYSSHGFGIHVNEEITRENPIRHDDVGYWFIGKSLGAGSCGLFISNVNLDHLGEWTCAAKLEGQQGNDEVLDTIFVVSRNTGNLTATAAAGIGVAVAILVLGIAAVGYKVMKKHNYKIPLVNCRRRQKTERSAEVQDICFLSQISASSSVTASSSESDQP